MSSAEYQRRWRASHGARTGKVGRPAFHRVASDAFAAHCDTCGAAFYKVEGRQADKRSARCGCGHPYSSHRVEDGMCMVMGCPCGPDPEEVER